jgi:hypothetical protein
MKEKTFKQLNRAKHFQDNKEQEYLTHKEYIKNNPWLPSIYNAKKRCVNPNDKRYYRYGARGIKCLLSVQEAKELWFRDKAFEMKKPSIDRKDVNKNYTFGNCQYIEFLENTVKDKYKKIYEIRNNKVLKVWNSLTEIRTITGWDISNITDSIRMGRMAHGSYWKR